MSILVTSSSFNILSWALKKTDKYDKMLLNLLSKKTTPNQDGDI